MGLVGRNQKSVREDLHTRSLNTQCKWSLDKIGRTLEILG
jgi:hypothetical protein